MQQGNICATIIGVQKSVHNEMILFHDTMLFSNSLVSGHSHFPE